MKKNRCFALALGALTVLSSCSFGLLPARKAGGNATVSLQIRQLDPLSGTSDARAVVQGDAFLYIRTLGGPVGESGPLYGPYRVSAGTAFETDEIPAGTYTDGFGVIYATREIGEAATAILRKSDDELKTEAVWQELSDTLAGIASTGKTDAVTVKDGAKNKISITLVPVIEKSASIDLTETRNVSLAADPSGSTVRKFLLLENVADASPVAGFLKPSKLLCTASGAGAVTQVALYDEQGSLLPGGTYDAAKKRYSVPYTTGKEFYLYVEYSGGPVALAFDAVFGDDSTTGGNVTVSVKNAGDLAGMNVVFYLASTEKDAIPVGVGTFKIQGDGSGSGSAVSLFTGMPVTVAPGTYMLMAFIDVNGNAGISYKYDSSDYLYMDEAAVVTGSGASFVIEYGKFVVIPVTPDPPTMPFTYYVANGPLGAGDGSSLENACTIADALNLIAVNASTSSDMNWIYLTEDLKVIPGSGYNVPALKPVTIGSYTGNYSIMLKSAGANSVFCVSSDANLSLDNVTICGDIPNSYYASNGLISVQSNGTLTLYSGAVVSNNTSLSDGSGLCLKGGSATLDGGIITNCTTSKSGGGVYVDDGAAFSLRNGKIAGCVADEGGGISVSTSGSFYMYDGTISGCKALNTTTGGGGVYSAGVFSQSGGTIQANDSLCHGGGVYLKTGSLSISGYSKICGNTVTKLGGGIYIETITAFSGTSQDIAITGNITRSVDKGTGVYFHDNNASGEPIDFFTKAPGVTGNLYDNGASISENNVFVEK